MRIKKAVRRKVYINGSIVFENKARISVFDRGLLYGDGLFETMKATDGVIAFKDAHIKRLQRGARLMEIPAKPLAGFFAEIKAGILEKLIETNGLGTGPAYMRITITRGHDKSPLFFQRWGTSSPTLKKGGLGGDSTPTIFVMTRPLDAEAILKQQAAGIKAVFVKPEGCCPAISWIKTLNYLPSVLGKAQAARKGAGEGIFINSNGCVTEATGANLFIVTRGGIIKTAPVYEGLPGKGVLPGIIRHAVIKKAIRLGIHVKETAIRPADLVNAKEAFLTNSCIEICPLVAIDAAIIGNGSPGKVTRIIQRAFGLYI